MNLPDHDLAIVGGGFAGLACAQAAARRGVRTVVLDRKTRAGASVHTTGLLVKEAADRFDVPRTLTRTLSKIRLYSPNLRFIDLESPGYYFLATDTPGLLRWMAGEAEKAGAELRWNSPFRTARPSGKFWDIQPGGVRARFLVGADGAKSAVARDQGLDTNRRFLLGVEGEWTGVGGLEEDRIHVFLDATHARGYIGWVVPGVGFTQIGLAVNSHYTPDLKPWLEKIRPLFDFSSAKEWHRRGGLIPCGRTLRHTSARRLLLLGDAAGTVSPLTAGGIHPALELGRLAGIALSDFLLNRGPDPALILQPSTPAYLTKGLLRTVFDLLPASDALFDFALDNPLFRRAARTIFFHHRGLLSLDAWKDLLGAGTGRRPEQS
jgi:flavin-dependent dehydrogenase